MRPAAQRSAILLLAIAAVACSARTPSATPSPSGSPVGSTEQVPPTDGATAPGPTPGASGASGAMPAPITLLYDTDVAGDDLVALAFLLAAPNVTLAGITASGTGEARCAGGVDVVLRLLDRLHAPDIPVACGRMTPLQGNHAFPDAWRDRADAGSGLDLTATTRRASTMSAVELIIAASKAHADLHVLTSGPLTNLADALLADPGLADRLGAITVMGGAIHVPGNLAGPGAPDGNAVAEWNIYVDPHAANVVLASDVRPAFASLDGTNQVPISWDFAQRAIKTAERPPARILRDLLVANPWMEQGSSFLWDSTAAMVAAGYPIGSVTPTAITILEDEGPASGATRPANGPPNIEYLSHVDPTAAQDTLLGVLGGG
jgi:inosine-uridine nucleoside N-ribohydrolase